MSTPLPPVRRIVTGIDANGRSYIAEDGVSPAMLTIAARPDYRNNNIWRTVGSPAPLDAADSALEQRGVLPPKGGTVIRVIDIPPEEKDPVLRRRQTEAVFAAQFADAKHDSSHTRHPGMHVTDTIDYGIVIRGRVTLELDDGVKVDLASGDCVVQNGTMHAWRTIGTEPCLMAFIMIGATRV